MLLTTDSNGGDVLEGLIFFEKRTQCALQKISTPLKHNPDGF
jgi:hypothetical protein